MRLYATIAALTSVVAIASAGSSAFADAVNTNVSKNNTNQAQSYTVQAGDYLSAIAAKYNTTYVRLFDANSQISNPDLIYPGQVLTIPAANDQLPNRLAPSSGATASTVSSPVDNDTDAQQQTASPATQATPVMDSETEPQQSSSPSTNIAPAVASGSIWDELAQCESSGNWAANTGNGYYGGLQFTLSSWQSVGGTGYPNQASRDEQIMRAQMLQAKQGWGAWPVCSTKIGL